MTTIEAAILADMERGAGDGVGSDAQGVADTLGLSLRDVSIAMAAMERRQEIAQYYSYYWQCTAYATNDRAREHRIIR